MQTMHMKKFNQLAELPLDYQVPDVIWGTIPITEAERQIIQSPIFTRLLEVKQMGVMSVGFPGAIHNRYQHSLGVMHVADQMLGMVKFVSADGTQMYLGNLPDIDQQVRQGLRIAALLHDIGHPPLSHVIEEALRKYPELLEIEVMPDFLQQLVYKGRYSHENATKFLIKNQKELSELLIHHLKGDVLDQLPLLAVGEADTYPYNLLNPIINGDLDADKIDYLKRDAHYCGFVATFNLLDFDQAIRIEQVDDNQNASPHVYVEERAIGAINAFLHSRYREIDEFHHSQKPRIASQIIINDIAEHLRTLSPDKRPALIEGLHLHYRDSDLSTLFDTDNERAKRLDSIRRGQVNYDEVFLKRSDSEEKPLEFFDFRPPFRLCLHTLLSYPPGIARVQTVLREKFDCDQLIVDIRTAKPPRFSLNVDVRHGFRPTIFTVSETTRGLLRDSIRNLKVHFYVPIGVEPNLEMPVILDCIEATSHWCSNRFYEKDGSIFSHHLLLLIFHALHEHAKQELKIIDSWIYGLWQLQSFVAKVCETAQVKCPYKNLDGDNADSDLVRDIEILTTLGLVIQRAVSVNYPTNDNMKYLYVDRHDCRLTDHGKKLCTTALLQAYDASVLEGIRKTINDLQNGSLEDLIQFAKSEAERSEADTPTENRGSDNVPTRSEIRNRTKRKSCLVIA